MAFTMLFAAIISRICPTSVFYLSDISLVRRFLDFSSEEMKYQCTENPGRGAFVFKGGYGARTRKQVKKGCFF